ncbi:RRP15-like protein like [Argiope bruennichi]|uniref:RRP15-like protein n=1 Tax=Argiope bruennichi TaxID=94029 RepID=A0A8T0EDL6_ARGBR|nr:RRP15-like protein like [Argiope bruennichi]
MGKRKLSRNIDEVGRNNIVSKNNESDQNEDENEEMTENDMDIFAEGISESDIDSADGNVADESSEGENESVDADECSNSENNLIIGNEGWADAMAKVLHTTTKGSKFILSKAKKDRDIKAKDNKQLELVDETGQVIKKEMPEKSKSFSEKRKEMLEKQKLKAEWEAMCRVKPDVRNKDRERELIKIATRGVVHLFNTVEKHQKTVKNSKKNKQKDKKLSVVKGNFMDILKECAKKDKDVQEDPAAKKAKQEATWSILKDDFMMGAEMKDWDKDDENT